MYCTYFERMFGKKIRSSLRHSNAVCTIRANNVIFKYFPSNSNRNHKKWLDFKICRKISSRNTCFLSKNQYMYK